MIPELTLVSSDASPLPGFLDQSAESLHAWLAERKEPPMRVKQIRRWIVARRATSFDVMTDLPAKLRPELAAHFAPLTMRVDKHLIASDLTNKLLLRLHDGHRIECVLIQDENRKTACISTQVGCAMGCVFCASGLNGLERNLTSGEILEQLVRMRNLLPEDGRLSHIVVMGMGEPMANLDNLLEALRLAGDKDGLNIGARHITISTVGLPAKMRALADHGKQYHLAVSLHAPNDAMRSKIVPTNEKIGMTAILDAADYFQVKTGRQVTYEYVVLGGINDGQREARELSQLLRGRQAHVNLIPFNEVDGLPWKRPQTDDLKAFIETIEQSGISVKVRKRKGSDIDAACGQLRRQADAISSPALSS